MHNMDEQIEYVLDDFDFESVHIAMKALDRKWYFENDDLKMIPTVSQLKEHAKEMLIKLTSSKPKVSRICTGGFEAENHEGFISLNFILEEADSYLLNSENYPMRTKYLTGEFD